MRASETRFGPFHLLVGLLVLILTASAHSEKVVGEYDEIVFVGMEVTRFDTTCVIISAFLKGQDFFKGLKRVETSRGLEFRKDHKTVKSFPDEIVIEIRADVLGCPKRRLFEVPPLAEDFMNSLQFQAKWKTQFEMRPIENLSVERIRLPWSEYPKIWLYRITLPSKGIPLADSLVILVLSGKQKVITKFSARL